MKKENTGISSYLTNEQFFLEEEQPLCEHNRQSLKVKPTAHIPESSQKDQIIRSDGRYYMKQQAGGW